MEILDTLTYWFWIPVLFWVGLYFWFHRVSYPLYMKKLVKNGQKWAYVPRVRSYFKLFDLIFTLVMAAVSALPAIWVIYNWTDLEWFYGFAVSPLFLIVGVILCKIAKKSTANMYRNAYFLEYRRVRYESESKGDFRSETDVQNRTIWNFTKKLKEAESKGRLWEMVYLMSKTKKIPPDVYAETMYG